MRSLGKKTGKNGKKCCSSSEEPRKKMGKKTLLLESGASGKKNEKKCCSSSQEPREKNGNTMGEKMGGKMLFLGKKMRKNATPHSTAVACVGRVFVTRRLARRAPAFFYLPRGPCETVLRLAVSHRETLKGSNRSPMLGTHLLRPRTVCSLLRAIEL